MIRKIWFYLWRLIAVVLMLAWTYFRFERIGDTTMGMIKIGIDIIVIGCITHKIFTSRFCWRSPRQFVESMCNSENKLVNITKWATPWILIIAFGLGFAYKFGLGTEGMLITTCLILLFICISTVIGFINYCLIKKEKEDV